MMFTRSLPAMIYLLGSHHYGVVFCLLQAQAQLRHGCSMMIVKL